MAEDANGGAPESAFGRLGIELVVAQRLEDHAHVREVLLALVDPSLAAQVGRVLTEGTGSFGLRAVTVERWASPRQLDEVDVDGVAIRIKVGPGRVKAEYDDAVVAARRLGRPLRSVLADAEESWRRTHPDGDGVPADSTGPMGTVAPLHDHVHPHDHDHSHSHDHDHPHPHDPSDGNAG